MTSTPCDTKQVEQCDREAAADRLHGHRSAISTGEAHTIGMLRSGKMDHHPWVQAFAAHRLAEQERCALIAAGYKQNGYNEQSTAIAAAIRSGSSPEPEICAKSAPKSEPVKETPESSHVAEDVERNGGNFDTDALEGYRAAVAWIGADSWDGCSDCIAWLKAACAADWDRDPMTPDELAAALKKLYPHKPGVLGNRPEIPGSSTAQPSLTDEREAAAAKPSPLEWHNATTCPCMAAERYVSTCPRHGVPRKSKGPTEQEIKPSLTDEREAIARLEGMCSIGATGILETYGTFRHPEVTMMADVRKLLLALRRPTETEVAVLLDREALIDTLGDLIVGEKVDPFTEPEKRDWLEKIADAVLALLPGTQGEERHD